MLEAFKIKEFDLNPIFEAWPNPPIFYGESKKDMPVDDWLNQIKAGCVERKVPEEYWHKVAQHYMGEKAKGRLTELKNVMAQVNGGKYRWSWKKFKIAMKNMGWSIDVTVTTPVTVQRRSSGSFWLTRRMTSKGQVSKDTEIVEVARVEAPLPPPKESRPNPVKMFSDSAIIAATSAFKSRHSPQRSNTVGPAVTTTSAFASALSVAPLPPLPPLPIATQPTPENNAVTTVSNVPTWLLNACHALDFLTTEHPRAMTTLSAVLITAGTLPAIPAISGGTVLASGVAQAVGAIAVGVGNLLKAQHEGQIQVSGQTPAQAPAGFHAPMRAATFQ
ncbi:hypothetical protein PAXINDRAFT_170239 [Paxillus involutus ATCC 200175]|uniref:Unplaced genomic scaffold PAXINscaffold_27, whole genome shotgun sequence n=1 Tax=Paxillus involutus ATCC 200175 TaxID=664439 RepID=A0A0C9SW76_PAXIN|nr:hypothetical protein PAXINDRAFT_170239 [Paxillus involutus ATCC 200175]